MGSERKTHNCQAQLTNSPSHQACGLSGHFVDVQYQAEEGSVRSVRESSWTFDQLQHSACSHREEQGRHRLQNRLVCWVSARQADPCCMLNQLSETRKGVAGCPWQSPACVCSDFQWCARNVSKWKFQTHERFKRMLFIRRRQNQQILGVIPFAKLQNDI